MSANQELISMCGKIATIILDDCRKKHMLDPRERNLNPEYAVDISLSIGEIKSFMDALHRARKRAKR